MLNEEATRLGALEARIVLVAANLRVTSLIEARSPRSWNRDILTLYLLTISLSIRSILNYT